MINNTSLSRARAHEDNSTQISTRGGRWCRIGLVLTWLLILALLLVGNADFIKNASFEDGETDGWTMKYYFTHLSISLLIFLGSSGLHYVVVEWLSLVNSSYLAGFMAAVPFYLSREIRDYEKLNQGWDLPGLLAPTIGCILVLIILTIIEKLWRWKWPTPSSSNHDRTPKDRIVDEDQV